MRFDGKVVLVTGSTSGIGEACARLFAESGATVMVSGPPHSDAAMRWSIDPPRGRHARFSPRICAPRAPASGW